MRKNLNVIADYSIRLDGARVGRGRVNELGGATRTERVSFAPPPDRESSWLLRINFTLYGVEETRFGPWLTDQRMTGGTVKRFVITWSGGKARLRKRNLSTEEYYRYQRECGR